VVLSRVTYLLPAFVLLRRNKDLRSRPAPTPARAILLQTLGTLALMFNVVS
jgi:hypothetical protein